MGLSPSRGSRSVSRPCDSRVCLWWMPRIALEVFPPVSQLLRHLIFPVVNGRWLLSHVLIASGGGVGRAGGRLSSRSLPPWPWHGLGSTGHLFLKDPTSVCTRGAGLSSFFVGSTRLWFGVPWALYSELGGDLTSIFRKSSVRWLLISSVSVPNAP